MIKLYIAELFIGAIIGKGESAPVWIDVSS
jgi:hypothetical protein